MEAKNSKLSSAKIMDQLAAAETVFFDYDGVIKDTVSIKGDAFKLIFGRYGENIGTAANLHHKNNGGMSRYEKIPLYLSWANVSPTQGLIDTISLQLSTLVVQKIIDAPWVPGCFEYLEKNCVRQNLFLVSAAPEEELKNILIDTKIFSFFKEVYGAPSDKTNSVRKIVNYHSINTEKAFFIGDAEADYLAAKANKIQFVLRKTCLNSNSNLSQNPLSIDDFLGA